MGRYVLAIKGNERIHVGETAAFIQHIGRGEDGENFEADRLVELAGSFELYDEDGSPLDVKLDGGNVELVRKPNADPVPGELLVGRINFLLAQAQAQLDQARSDTVDALSYAVAAANDTGQGVLNNQVSATEIAAKTKDLVNDFEKVRGVLDVHPFPVIQADLAVVLAALSEDFGSAVHGGGRNRGNAHHNELHRQGKAH